MSEYQYYEWQTLGRPLTPEERAAVSRLSSHIEVTSSQAVVTYSWGDFKHDPIQVLARVLSRGAAGVQGCGGGVSPAPLLPCPLQGGEWWK